MIPNKFWLRDALPEHPVWACVMWAAVAVTPRIPGSGAGSRSSLSTSVVSVVWGQWEESQRPRPLWSLAVCKHHLTICTWITWLAQFLSLSLFSWLSNEKGTFPSLFVCVSPHGFLFYAIPCYHYLVWCWDDLRFDQWGGSLHAGAFIFCNLPPSFPPFIIHFPFSPSDLIQLWDQPFLWFILEENSISKHNLWVRCPH